MEIGKSIRFIPQQRQWPGGCAPPRSRPGAHPEVPRLVAAARNKKNAGLAGGASPSPEVDALRLAIHMCSVRITARSWPAQM